MERGGVTLALAFIAGILFAFLFPLPLSVWAGILFPLLLVYARLYYCLFHPRKNISPYCRPLWGRKKVKRHTAVRYFITTGRLILMTAGAIHLCQNPAYRKLTGELSLQTAAGPQREYRADHFRYKAEVRGIPGEINLRNISMDEHAAPKNIRKREKIQQASGPAVTGPQANRRFEGKIIHKRKEVPYSNGKPLSLPPVNELAGKGIPCAPVSCRDKNIENKGISCLEQVFSALKSRWKTTKEKIKRLNYSSRRSVLTEKTGRIRSFLAGRLKKMVPSQTEYSVLAALTLGDKSGIPRELKQAYKNSGAMHVLALSGLHTGILYTIIGIFFLPLDFHYKTRRIKWLLSLASIAFYAVITGMNAPVLRAGIMIGIYRATATGRRKSGKWNAVCLAAGTIVLFSPLELFKIGFQLSFAAVCGIAGLYGTINNSAGLKSKLPGKIWSLLSLSVACQIATAPLVYLYFKNIPSYFLLTNLVAVPLVTIILYLFIVSILLYGIPTAGPLLAFLLQQSLRALNFLIGFIGK